MNNKIRYIIIFSIILISSFLIYLYYPYHLERIKFNEKIIRKIRKININNSK